MRKVFKDPRIVVRAVLGVLLAANIVAAVLAIRPWGGSPEDLARQQESLRKQLQDLQARVTRTKALVDKIEQAKQQDQKFLAQYVMDRRTTFSTIFSELNQTAKEAGIKARESSYVVEPVEGSDTLQQMTISAGYEGTYANLTKFVNLLDKSPRFLIIENMVASPQQATQNLNVSFKLDTFVKAQPGGAS